MMFNMKLTYFAVIWQVDTTSADLGRLMLSGYSQGYVGCGNCVDYSTLHPFNSASYYHPFCFIDYSNPQSVTNCWEGENSRYLPRVVTLADLNHRKQYRLAA